MASPSFSPRRVVAAAAVAAAWVAFAAHAEEFSWQLSGALRQTESGSFKNDSWALDATFYMKPIADSSGPYALASFLNPTTRVSLAASKIDMPQDPAAYTLDGAYVLPGEKWYVGGDYAKSVLEDAPPVTFSGPKGYGLRAGRYLGANTTLELRMGRSEETTTVGCQLPPGQVCIDSPIDFDVTTDSVGLEVFHVGRFRSLTYSLQGSVAERETDSEVRSLLLGVLPTNGGSTRQYSVAAELFPTDRLGVRIGYSRPEDYVDSYDVTATWFFKPKVAVQLGLSQLSLDGAGPGFSRPETIGVRFIGRL